MSALNKNVIKKRVYGIQLSNWYPSATLPLAIGSVWSYAQIDPTIAENYQLIDVFWQEESVTDVLDIIVAPDVLMCSCYVWNWQKTNEIIKSVKSQFPDCLVIIGGPEPEYSSEWMANHPHIDLLVAYYGEQTFKTILKEFVINQRLNFDHIPGVVNKFVNNKDKFLPATLDDIPSPYLNGFFDQLLTRKKNYIKSIRAVFESNRGCPYSCSYCDLGAKQYQKIKAYSSEKCLSELEWMVKNNISVIDVSDSNFGMFPRDEIFIDKLIQLKNDYGYTGTFLPTWSKTKGRHILNLGKKIIKSGLDTSYNISIQSPNVETLKLVNRTNAFKFDELSDVIKYLHDDQVSVYTDLIFPMPGDTKTSYNQGVLNILDLNSTFNKIQINHLSRISNSTLGKFDSDKFQIKWVNILGNSRHYYGEDVQDTLAISTKYINEIEVFDSLFFTKCVVLPFYYYGISQNLCNALHEAKIMRRSEVMTLIFNELLNLKWFIDFKNSMKEHYFSAIHSGTHFGHKLDETGQYYPEFAKAYRTYIDNHVFDIIRSIFIDYNEIVNFDEQSNWNNKKINTKVELKKWNPGVWLLSDNRELNFPAYLSQVFIKGRFSDEWRVNQIRKIG